MQTTCPECLEQYSPENPKASCTAFDWCVRCHDAANCCPTEPDFEPCDVLTDAELVGSYPATLVDRVIAIVDGAL